MNLTVKRIPEEVYLAIKNEAKRQKRSLNAQVLHALEVDAAEAERRQQYEQRRKELDEFVASLKPMTSSVALIRQGRKR